MRLGTGYFIAVLVAAFLMSCTVTPITRTQLFPGIERPRDRNDIDITITKIPGTAWGKCLEIVGGARAVFSALFIFPIHGCARFPRDDELEPTPFPSLLRVPFHSPPLFDGL